MSVGKSIMIFRNSASPFSPILDSVSVTLTKTISPFTIFTGATITGPNNGSRTFTNVADGDYNVKFDGVLQSEYNPLYVPGTGGVTNTTIAAGDVGTTELATNAVTNVKIGTGAVDTDELAANSVTSAKIASGAVDGANLSSSSVTKTKLASGVFNGKMADSGGWGPKYDNVTIGVDGINNLEVKSGGIDTTQILDDAITTNKVLDDAITTAKIGTQVVIAINVASTVLDYYHLVDGAITTAKILAEAVTAAKLGPLSVIASKVGTSVIAGVHIVPGTITNDKIAEDAISMSHLSTTLANSMLRFPSKEAQVSPEFSDNVSPYFDNISDAYDDVVASDGTIIIHPGTYTTAVTLAASVNLIGVDRTRSIIQVTGTSSSTNFGVKVTGLSSKDLLIRELTIKCLGQAGTSQPMYGLRIDNCTGNWVRIEDCIIKGQGSNLATNPLTSYGMYLNIVDALIKNCYIESVGALRTSSGSDGDSRGLYISGSSILTISDCDIQAMHGQTTPNGTPTGHTIEFGDASPDFLTQRCTLIAETNGGTNYCFKGASAITIDVISSMYNKSDDSNVTITESPGVNSKLSTNVVIKENVS